MCRLPPVTMAETEIAARLVPGGGILSLVGDVAQAASACLA